jgi:hypothetical protein
VSTSALAGSLPTGRGFRPSAFKHCRTGVSWRAIPRELRDLGDGFPHRRRGMLPKVRFESGTRGGQLALRPLVVALLPLRETANHLGLEGAMDARLRHATQPQNRLNGSPLTAPGEGLQAYLHPPVRRLNRPYRNASRSSALKWSVRLVKAFCSGGASPPQEYSRQRRLKQVSAKLVRSISHIKAESDRCLASRGGYSANH